jgi:stalled ribosome alternative rescue factor ArfA
VDPRAGLDDLEKRKFLTLPELELHPLCRPARSQSLCRLRYPGSSIKRGGKGIWERKMRRNGLRYFDKKFYKVWFSHSKVNRGDTHTGTHTDRLTESMMIS